MSEYHLSDGFGSQEVLWLHANGGDEVEAELLKVLAALAPAGLAGDKWLVRTP
jgi:hypothetical protein